MSENYRIALEKRIAARKVYLNDKQSVVTGYEELGSLTVVFVEGKEHILKETDNIIINGNEKL